MLISLRSGRRFLQVVTPPLSCSTQKRVRVLRRPELHPLLWHQRWFRLHQQRASRLPSSPVAKRISKPTKPWRCPCCGGINRCEAYILSERLLEQA